MNRNKPIIRFNGYTSTWELRIVDDIANRFDNLRIPVPASERVKGNIPYYGANGIQDYVEGFTHEGQFVLVAEDGANDLKNYPVQFVSGKVWVNNHAHVLQSKVGISDNVFLVNSFKNINIEPFLVGGGRSKLNADVMMKISLLIPSLQEQQQIGIFFQSIDNLITLHQSKLETTNSLKKTMLSKMFPKSGQDKPELRFNEYTDAWELRKLKEFADKAVDNRGKTPPTDINGTHPLIEVASLGTGSPDYSKVEKYLNDYAFENNLRGYLKKGDILFSTVGSIGQVSLMDDCEYAAIAQNIVGFRAKEGYLPGFLYSLLSTERSKNEAYKIVMGAVQPSIKVSQLVNVEYSVTKNIDEQKKIGTFFSNLDNLITLHQRELEKLKLMKQYLLKNMIV